MQVDPRILLFIKDPFADLGLTEIQKAVATRFLHGATMDEIASERGISKSAVEASLKYASVKIGVQTRKFADWYIARLIAIIEAP